MTAPEGRSLRQLFSRKKPWILPGAGNALTARILQDIGYEAIYVTGAGITNLSLALPDIGVLTIDQLLDTVSRIRDVVETPLVVDADTGFGNAVQVGRTVRRLEAAGANAIQIEDQLYPKRCGHFDGKQLITAAEMVQKIRAACDGRRSEDLLIVGRTDACSVEGVEAAIDRANAYREAGADVIFVEAPGSYAQMAQITSSVPGPHIMNQVVGGKSPLLSLTELERLGYDVALYANIALHATIKAVSEVMGELLTTSSVEPIRHRLASWEERQRLVQKPQYDELEARYATPEPVEDLEAAET